MLASGLYVERNVRYLCKLVKHCSVCIVQTKLSGMLIPETFITLRTIYSIDKTDNNLKTGLEMLGLTPSSSLLL